MLNRWVEEELLDTPRGTRRRLHCLFSAGPRDCLTEKYLYGIPESARAKDGLWFKKEFLSEGNSGACAGAARNCKWARADAGTDGDQLGCYVMSG